MRNKIDLDAYTIACEEILAEGMTEVTEEISEKIHKDAKEIEFFLEDSLNHDIARAKAEPTPREFFDSYVYEGECTCLFGDTGCGKSILAIQIADHITKTYGMKVAYFDFELSSKQQERRYSTEDGKTYRFPENLRRVTFNPACGGSMSNDKEIFDKMREKALKMNAKVIILDNITWVCMDTEKGEFAQRLMQGMWSLCRNEGFTVLVLAHTPKIPEGRKITVNDLAGSKRLSNFFDAIFAIGQSVRDNRLKYLKQVKIRQAEKVHDEHNVQVYESIKSDDGNLHFEYRYHGEEGELLKVGDLTRDEMKQRVLAEAKSGAIKTDVARKYGISTKTIQRWLKGGAV